jgi:hypothetical protein
LKLVATDRLLYKTKANSPSTSLFSTIRKTEFASGQLSAFKTLIAIRGPLSARQEGVQGGIGGLLSTFNNLVLPIK